MRLASLIRMSSSFLYDQVDGKYVSGDVHIQLYVTQTTLLCREKGSC